MPIKVAMVDQHRLFCEGVRALLTTQPEMRFVGAAADATTAHKLVLDMQPDVVLVDSDVPGSSGLRLTRELRGRAPELRVIFVSAQPSKDAVRQAVEAGALGCVCKTSPSEELFGAIQRVAIGSPYFPAGLENVARPGAPTELDRLSAREREVYLLLLTGAGNEGIGRILEISPRTVETHRANIMRKLNAKTLADLFRIAVRAGIPLE